MALVFSRRLAWPTRGIAQLAAGFRLPWRRGGARFLSPVANRVFALLSLLPGLLVGGWSAFGQTTEPVSSQTVALSPGWNAVYLTVDPLDPSPAAVFGGMPVTKVAAFFPSRTPVEFIQDPASPDWKQQGWSVWYAPVLPEAAISDLSSILGGQGYLVFATANCTLNLQGKVRLRRVRWRSDSFNFVGFPVDSLSPPTFAAWFAGTAAHLSATRPTIFTLDSSGHWRAVDHPESTQIQPGRAYWVYALGSSDYQGPLDVLIQGGAPNVGADFGGVTEFLTLRFRNRTGTPIRFSLDLAPTDSLPLSYLRLLPTGLTRQAVRLTTPTDLGSLEGASQLDVRLVLDRALLSRTNAAAVLTVRDDVGSFVQIPVTGSLP